MKNPEPIKNAAPQMNHLWSSDALSVSKNTYLIVSRMEVPMVPFGIAIPKFSAMEAVNLLSLFSIFLCILSISFM